MQFGPCMHNSCGCQQNGFYASQSQKSIEEQLRDIERDEVALKRHKDRLQDKPKDDKDKKASKKDVSELSQLLFFSSFPLGVFFLFVMAVFRPEAFRIIFG